MLELDCYDLPKTNFEIYKDLVLKKDKLQKEEELILRTYLSAFGALLEKRLQLQIECIKAKKTIAFCQAKQNRLEDIDQAELERYLEFELFEYYAQLTELVTLSKEVGRAISEFEQLKIKKIYKEIALLVHPDLHPKRIFSLELLTLWKKAKTAYKCNDLEGIIEAKLLILDELKLNPLNDDDSFDEELVKKKITKLTQAIQEILSNDPYRYKDILEDEKAITAKKKHLREEIDEYQIYLKGLQEQLKKYPIKEWLN